MHSVEGELRPFLALTTWQDGKFKQTALGMSSHSQNPNRVGSSIAAIIPEKIITDHIKEQFKPLRGRLPQSDFRHTVATLLIKNYFAENAYFTSKSLQLEAGCSYPTLQRVFQTLDPWLERESSRSVRLRSFPKDLWWKLLSNAPSARHSTYYEDVSGQPRSIDSLLKRFRGMKEDKIAIGGVTAALHHNPKLDIVGSPRLDLVIHASPWEDTPNLSVISPDELAIRIDPGLAETNHPTAPIRLAIHYLRRASNDFSNDPKNGNLIADPIECLYDLHEARLSPQAEELLSFLNHNRSQKS